MDAVGDITLKSVTDSDKEEWAGLWVQYLTFYKVDIPEAVTEVTWQRLLNSEESMGCVMAWQGAKAVGLANHVQHRSTWATGNYLYLEDLFVDASVRGRGVGRKLISSLYELAARAGCSRVYWHTHETNSTAMLLYDRIGDRSGFVHYQRQLS